MEDENTLKESEDILKDALEALSNQYVSWEEKTGETREAYRVRIAALKDLIKGSPSPEVAVKAETKTQDEPGYRLSISDRRLGAIREYLRTHESVRQADISKHLGFNSGTISVGLRVLHEEGVVKPGGIDHGSRLWEYTAVPVAA